MFFVSKLQCEKLAVALCQFLATASFLVSSISPHIIKYLFTVETHTLDVTVFAHSELLEGYSKCRSASEVVSFQQEWLERERSRQRDRQGGRS